MSRLRNWIERSLNLRSAEDAKQVDALLWEAPRALMTSVIPTLLRRLETGWLSRDEVGKEYHIGFPSHHPLPEFVPANLFSDLNLPEITVWAVLRLGQEPEMHPFLQPKHLENSLLGESLDALAFGIVYHATGLEWMQRVIRYNISTSTPSVLLTSEKKLASSHTVEMTEPPRGSVYRPYALHVRNDADENISDSSNAMLDWHSRILPPTGSSASLEVAQHSEWVPVIKGIRFFTHSMHQPVRVTRFALGSQANLRFKDGQELDLTCRFYTETDEERQPAALGFTFDADAIRVRVRYPEDWKLSSDDVSPQKLPSLKCAYFKWRVLDDERFEGIANIFQRQWFAEIVFTR